MRAQKIRVRQLIALSIIGFLTGLLVSGCSSTSTTPKDQAQAAESRASVKSPDGTIEMTLLGHGQVTYSVAVDGKPVLANSKLWKDGPDCETEGEHLISETRIISRNDELALHLAPAGGAVASFELKSRP